MVWNFYIYLFFFRKIKEEEEEEEKGWRIACGDCSGMNHDTTRSKRRLFRSLLRSLCNIVFQEDPNLKRFSFQLLKDFPKERERKKRKRTWLVPTKQSAIKKKKKKKNWVVVIVHPRSSGDILASSCLKRNTRYDTARHDTTRHEDDVLAPAKHIPIPFRKRRRRSKKK